MDHNLIGITSILGFGVCAQWLAWRLRIPSILFLLVFGFLAGPVTHLVNPDVLLGDLLFPLVSISVGVILFEGGLSLKISEIRQVAGPVRNLVSVGVLVTWTLTSLAAYHILKFPLSMAILLGAILVVTGPTVIVPLLRHLRLSGRLSPILKWEAIIVDPIGVILAVVVFEIILSGSFHVAPNIAVIELAKTFVFGALFGGLSGWVMVSLLRRYWIPDYLQSVVTLMVVAVAFGVTNHFQAESGLLAVTVMGIVLANQKKISIQHIVEFKENLRVLLISSLFIILAARLELDTLTRIDVPTFVFFGCLVFVIRPLAVFVSTLGSNLKWREKLFISWMAPRGIVAAATASIFVLSLEAAGHADAERLLTTTFFIIIGTVLLYGLTSPGMAYLLKVAQPNPQGLLILGAEEWVQRLALILKELKLKVLMVDTNGFNVRTARKNGLLAVSGNLLTDDFANKLDLSGIGHFLGMTSNAEVNSFAALSFSKILGRERVYQLPLAQEGTEKESIPQHLYGRPLFSSKMTHGYLAQSTRRSGIVRYRKLTVEYSLDNFKAEYGNRADMLFTLSPTGVLGMVTEGKMPEPKPETTLIFLVNESVRSQNNS